MSKKPQKIKIPHRLAPFLYICFFLSGAAGLIYEVVWARQLSLFLGITGFAHTAVITAYMAGLAGGSLFFGRRSDRLKNPLKIYAWLEIGVGLYAAVTPWMFTTLQVVYANVAGATGVEGTSGHFARFSIALLALLIPTFLMGGTLPLLVRGVVSELPDVGRITSRMYGVNTLGAMSGTLLAGYVLLEQLGIRATIFIAVALNLGIALWVFLVLAKHPTRQHKTKKTRHNTPAKIRGPGETGNSVTGAGLRFALLAGFGAAGFAALLTQLAWMRAMILLVGGSVYAFTIALSSFLAGIALGSLAYSRVFRNSRIDNVLERLSHAGVVAALVGLTIIGGIPLLAHLPQWYLAGYAAGLKDHFAAFQLYIFVLAFVLMLLPTLLMGLLFPLVTTIYTGQVSQTGQSVGTAYAVNTTGTILGTLLGGLFLLPWLGIQNSLILAGVIYVAVAVVFWSLANRRLTTSWRAGVPSMGVFILLVIVSLIPRWDTAIWGPGVYYDPEAIIKRLPDSNLHDIMSLLEVLYYEEGLDGTVVVRQNDYQKYLTINGKTDATAKRDAPTQLMLGHLPLLLHQTADDVLVIGLGSGMTVGAVALYPVMLYAD